MNRTKIGILTGIILIGLALWGYFGSGMESWTALIPSFFGAPIMLASLLARNPEKRKLGMHIAVTFGFLGFLAPLGRVIPKLAKGEFAFDLAGTMMIAMAVVCGIFLVLCIKSFIDARRMK